MPSDLRFEAPMRTNPMSALPDPCEGFKLNKFLDEIKLHQIQRALELSGGVQARAAPSARHHSAGDQPAHEIPESLVTPLLKLLI
jgi:hypothetical protein